MLQNINSERFINPTPVDTIHKIVSIYPQFGILWMHKHKLVNCINRIFDGSTHIILFCIHKMNKIDDIHLLPSLIRCNMKGEFKKSIIKKRFVSTPHPRHRNILYRGGK